MRKSKIILNTFLSVLFGCILFYIVFKNIDLELFIQKLDKVNYNWIYLSMLISVFEHILRSYRWNILMKKSTYQLSTFITTNIIIVSYFFALFIPRFNDIVRCYLISKTNKIKVSTSLGTVVSERIFDLFSLLIISILFILIEYDLFYNFIITYVFNNLSLSQNRIILIGLIIVISILFFIKYVKRSPFFSSRFLEFKSGILTIKENYKNLNFIISTLLLWITYLMMGYVIFFSFAETENLGFNAALAILIAGSIGMIVPVNAGIGAYHFLVASILLSYNLDYDTGLFFATVLHTSQIVCLAILGIFSSIVLFFKIRLNE